MNKINTCQVAGCLDPREYGFVFCNKHNKEFSNDTAMVTNVGQPVEYKVLVLPDVVEERTAGGIILAQTAREKEQLRAIKGTIIGLGGNCFEDWNAPIPVVGDRIIFAINAGTVHKADGKEYRIIHDKDIVMILPQEVKEDA